MFKKVLSFAFAASMSMGAAQAAVIGFEGGADPMFTYTDVGFVEVPVTASSGYNNVAAFTNSKWVAFNPYEATPAIFSLVGNLTDTFTLNSFVVASAWGAQTLLIEGLNNGAVLFSQKQGVTQSPIVFAANWAGIDQLRIWTGDEFQPGTGHQWALDNITINENNVPEPGSLALLAVGLAGVGALRRRGKTAA